MGVMAKVPRSGRVKTRLVPPLTPDQASALSECFLRDVAASIATAAATDHARIQGVAVYLADGEEQDFRHVLPREFLLLAQRGGHLGERLFHAAVDLLKAGFHSVCLVNADSPTLPSSLLGEAVLALQAPGDRVVLGPASDGGYYLIGLKRAHRRLFEEISWSTSSVFAQTFAGACLLLASAAVVAFSPRYTWYFAWLLPLATLRASAPILLLGLLSFLLYYEGWSTLWTGALIYVPFLLLALSRMRTPRPSSLIVPRSKESADGERPQPAA
jgi:rSAM/selenodomain-associated transferase 1